MLIKDSSPNNPCPTLSKINTNLNISFQNTSNTSRKLDLELEATTARKHTALLPSPTNKHRNHDKPNIKPYKTSQIFLKVRSCKFAAIKTGKLLSQS